MALPVQRHMRHKAESQSSRSTNNSVLQDNLEDQIWESVMKNFQSGTSSAKKERVVVNPALQHNEPY